MTRPRFARELISVTYVPQFAAPRPGKGQTSLAKRLACQRCRKNGRCRRQSSNHESSTTDEPKMFHPDNRKEVRTYERPDRVSGGRTGGAYRSRQRERRSRREQWEPRQRGLQRPPSAAGQQHRGLAWELSILTGSTTSSGSGEESASPGLP